MRRSSARGTGTSAADVEVLGLLPHALWLSVRGQEVMLDYRHFPWFRRASLEDALRVELRFDHLYWPALDVDLHLDSLAEPERFPRVARRPKPPRR